MLFISIGLLGLGLLFLLGSLDDFILDVVHFIYGLYPKKVTQKEVDSWMELPEKKIAVMIPAWQEYDVLEAMVKTNLKRIRYNNFHWYIGVYPNDQKTLDIAKKMETLYPTKITVVVNDLPGPTSKAQCLNVILKSMFFNQENLNIKSGYEFERPHYIAIHDAEDVIHPLAFKAINAQSDKTDFIQVPIFSLPVSTSKWVAGTYLDEFSDIHLREIPVRQKLRMPIPSAGVGTFFSWSILEILGRRFETWFDEGNLTEDYEVSMKIARLGGKQQFMLLADPDGDLIATREYFPESFGRSVRQKTRWTTGIGLQTAARWGAYQSPLTHFNLKTLMARYALWRDRKALWSNPLVYLGWASLLLCSGYYFVNPEWMSDLPFKEEIIVIMALNLMLFAIRLFQRARFTKNLYGLSHALMSVPRLILGSVINANAAIKALVHFGQAKKDKKEDKIVWDKTQHYFPSEEMLNKNKMVKQ